MEAAIEVAGLRKRFGPTVALDGMSFTVARGEVTGFVGPNGAGKTTTMRVILGLDAPEAGTAVVAGYPYRALRRPLTRLGSLLDAAALQPSRTGRNHLLWLAHSQGLAADRVDAVLGQAGLDKAARRRAGGYSLGMRQRLGIAAALLGDPPALMMDEPFNGMDPEGIIWMRGLLRSLAAEGRAVLVSSHLMSELEGTADHLVIVGRGHVLADTPTRDLLAAASGDRVTLRTTAPDRAAEALKLRTLPATGWLLLAVAAATVIISAAVSASVSCSSPADCHVDVVKLSLTGTYLGQAVVAIVAVLAVGGEYGTGMIATTLAAMPRRITVLAAKAAVVTAVTLAAGIPAVLGSVLAGQLILPGHGYTPANGYPVLSLANTTVLRAAAGTVLYLALVALLSLGVAAAVRDSAVAIGSVLGLLYLFPILAQVAVRPGVARHLEQIGPMTAGLEIQASTGLRHLPIGPWAGLGVLAAWAAAALLAGALVLRVRDA